MKMNLEIKAVPADACNQEKKDERLTHILDAIRDRQLLALNIETTSFCNLKCIFCRMHAERVGKTDEKGQSGGGKIKKHMSLELFKKIMEKCRGLDRLKTLFLHGLGEPLLNPHLVEMVRIAKTCDIAEKITLITNAVLLKQQLFRELVAAGVDNFRISLDVIDRDQYRKIKGADVGEVVLKNIDDCLVEIKNNSLPVSLSIECMESAVDKNYADESEKITEYFSEKIRRLPKVDVRLVKLVNWNERGERYEKFQRKFPCEQAFYMLMIHSDGDVSMCCKDDRKELLIGTVSSVDSLRDLLSSEKLIAMRKALLLQDYSLISACRHCDLRTSVDAELLEKKDFLLGFLFPVKKSLDNP
ncbi:MAG: radical SAM protein [Verrucomicrobiae bacterium]|nr:radical SAM protein [Verrucomicrobiae bacterium]